MNRREFLRACGALPFVGLAGVVESSQFNLGPSPIKLLGFEAMMSQCFDAFHATLIDPETFDGLAVRYSDDPKYWAGQR